MSKWTNERVEDVMRSYCSGDGKYSDGTYGIGLGEYIKRFGRNYAKVSKLMDDDEKASVAEDCKDIVETQNMMYYYMRKVRKAQKDLYKYMQVPKDIDILKTVYETQIKHQAEVTNHLLSISNKIDEQFERYKNMDHRLRVLENRVIPKNALVIGNEIIEFQDKLKIRGDCEENLE